MKFDISQLLKAYEIFIDCVVKKKSFNLISQPKYLGNYYPRLNSEINGWIDWNNDSVMVERFINAFEDPYPGAKTYINNKRVIIKQAQLHSGELPNHPYMAGLIIRKSEDWIVVALNDQNNLIIEKVMDKKNKNIISKLKQGDRFYTPLKFIEKSFSTRAQYDHKGLIIKKA